MKKLFCYNEGIISPKGKLRTSHHTDLPEISVTKFNVTRLDLLFHKAVKLFKEISSSVCGYLQNRMSSPCLPVRQSDLAKQERESKPKIHFSFEASWWQAFGNQSMTSKHRPYFYPRHKWRTLWPTFFMATSWWEQGWDSWDGLRFVLCASQLFADSLVLFKKQFKLPFDSRRNSPNESSLTPTF